MDVYGFSLSFCCFFFCMTSFMRYAFTAALRHPTVIFQSNSIVGGVSQPPIISSNFVDSNSQSLRLHSELLQFYLSSRFQTELLLDRTAAIPAFDAFDNQSGALVAQTMKRRVWKQSLRLEALDKKVQDVNFNYDRLVADDSLQGLRRALQNPVSSFKKYQEVTYRGLVCNIVQCRDAEFFIVNRCIIVDLVAKLAARKDYLSVFELAHMMFFNSSEGDHIQYLFVEQPRLLKTVLVTLRRMHQELYPFGHPLMASLDNRLRNVSSISLPEEKKLLRRQRDLMSPKLQLKTIQVFYSIWNTWQKFRTDFVDDGRVVSPIAPIIRQLTRLGLLFQIKFHLHHGVRRPNKRSSRRYLVDYQFSGNIEDLLYKGSLDDLGGEMFDNLIRLVLTELTSADLRVEYLSDSSNEERAMDLMVPELQTLQNLALYQRESQALLSSVIVLLTHLISKQVSAVPESSLYEEADRLALRKLKSMLSSAT